MTPDYTNSPDCSLVFLRYRYLVLFLVSTCLVLLPGNILYAGSSIGISKQKNEGRSQDVLPLKLIEFGGEVNKDIVYLRWSTSTEKNVNHFEAEKSIDGVNFTGIARQTAIGVRQSTESYLAEDFKPATGINYYRLKIVGNDNRVSYSKMIKIKFK